MLSAVMWRVRRVRLKFDSAAGLAVLARGELTIYPPSGALPDAVCSELLPKGDGALDLALRQLREKLLRTRLVRPEAKAAAAALPAASRGRHQPDRGRRARHAGNALPPLAGRRGRSSSRSASRATGRRTRSPHRTMLNCSQARSAACDVVSSAAAAAASKTSGRSTRRSSPEAIFESRIPVVSRRRATRPTSRSPTSSPTTGR